MSYSSQQQAPPAYPPQEQANPPPPAHVAPPPPAGYPTRDGAPLNSQQVPVETKSRGDGFWRGCCAGLCCCCALDICL